MQEIKFNEDSNCLLILGEICFTNIASLRSQGTNFLKNSVADTIHIDLESVTRVDHAALALLVAWKRDANFYKKSICYFNIPSSLSHMAEVCGVKFILANQND